MSLDLYALEPAAAIKVGDVIWLATTVGAEQVTAARTSALGGVVTLITPASSPHGFHFAPDAMVMVQRRSFARPEREGALI